ncbi:hypothetical protein [Spartinivicinus ruber]|uniref:hypothetical protein n=1 Tax=Spartinivicinus ruber TaxID=2683272 RepID=UPI0013CFFC4A|nr:hypothetical protein [Spartinivicinus ruber]
MKYLGILVLSSSLPACVGIPSLLEKNDYCQSVVCNEVAVFKPYPILMGLEQAEIIQTPAFKLKVPVYGEMHQSTLIRKQIVYQNQTGILIEQVAEKDFVLAIPRAFSKSQFRVSNYPEIMFLKTAQQPEPTGYYERYIWRLALTNKGNYFNSGNFYISKKSGIDLYHAEVKVGPITDMVFVTVATNPDILLKIYNYGLDPETFSNVLASIVFTI